MKLSILTATFNRADLITRLYNSIVENLYDKLDVEWLIMDDGSSDDTENVVKSFKNINNLDIHYFKQENQGKMQAINNLMEHVTGELVMDCDSDDYFVNDAFSKIYEKSEILLNDDSIYALIFLKNENPQKLSGNRFSSENVNTTMFDMYFKEGITGEKILVFRTDVRKKYKHELVDGEKFITEARMYHKMDENYFVKCFNIVVVEGEYLESGYTSNISKTFFEAPKGYYQYFKEILGKNMKGVIFGKRLYALKHYILFEYLIKANINLGNIDSIINKLLYLMIIIPGKIKARKLFYARS